MKRLALVLASSLVACASSAPPPKAPETTTTTSAALVAKDDPKESGDPLAVGGALEAASIPKIEKTPAKELRPKSRGDLEAAMAIVRTESTVERAVKRVTARIGKPTWTEDGKKRVWIAKDGKGCTRFVLDADGQADIENARVTEWRMLAATAQQNACTGEIRRGVQ
ncbi:MAG TPA: hypothetical protein VIF62_20435 [Labilithrix sp.]|jgi:hypothetical protein